MGARPSSYKKDADGAVALEAPPVARIDSPEQQVIKQWFREGSGHAIVRARAGSGKTTTILDAVQEAPETMILLAAYNSRIAKELKGRLVGDKAIAATMHSIGFQALKRGTGWMRCQVDDQRGRKLTEAVVPPRIHDTARRNITKLHTKAREMHPHCSGPEELIEMALLYDCAPQPGPSVEEIAEFAFKAMVEARKPSLAIDFADMIYLPTVLGLVKARFDLVVGDEAQDWSEPQLELALGVLKPNGRMCLVGDDRQGIYGFRGADTGSLDRMKAELGAQEFGLTTTFRCGSEIVKVAQQIVPDIMPRKGAHAGEVLYRDAWDLQKMVAPGDFILSRTNAPNVRIAMSLLRAGRRCRIEGKDIGKTLLAISKRMHRYGDVKSVDMWHVNLDTWEGMEVRRAIANNSDSRAEMVMDQADTLRAISDGATDTEEIDARIDTLFEDVMDDRTVIICSTIHKAKGLEADRVFILRDTLNPAVNCVCGHRHTYGKPKCKNTSCDCELYRPSPAALLEESNINYVAITRAKHLLVFVGGGTDAPR